MNGTALRIVLLCESFGVLGGVAQIVEELAGEFARAGHCVAVVSTPSSGGELERRLHLAVEQVRLDLPRIKPASWRHPERLFVHRRAVQLASFIRNWRADLLNVHGGLRNRFAPVIEACHETGTPLIQSIHLVPESGAREALAALAASRAVTFPSTAVKRAFERVSSSARRARIIRGGVNVEAAAGAPPFHHARPYIFCASRLDLRHKAVDALLAAFFMIAAEFPDVDLLIAGDGTDRAALERMIASAEFGSRVQLLLTRPHEELWSFYQGAVAFVMLSRMAEGLPLVFFEAMACGAAVIGTRSGGTPEIVIDGETGLLVEDNDPHKVAAALRLMLTDVAGRCRMAQNARQLALAHSWRSVAAEFVALYRECLG